MRFGPSGKSRVHPGGCDGSCHHPYSREPPSSIVGDALALFVTGAEASIVALAFAGGPASAVPLPLAFLLFNSLVENLLAEEDELQALAGNVLKVTDEIVNSKIAGNEATQFGDVVNGVRNWFLSEPYPEEKDNFIGSQHTAFLNNLASDAHIYEYADALKVEIASFELFFKALPLNAFDLTSTRRPWLIS
jgi:hypothetical protein